MGGPLADLEPARRGMVERQLVRRGIRDERVLDAMRRVRRELFVPEPLRARAYDDGPLPIGEGQTISQPYIVALMAEAAALGPADRVLEVGTGSGYAAAVLAELAAQVFTVERHADLGWDARERIEAAGLGNVEVRIGDGTLGWPAEAPFDAIVVAAGGPAVPGALKAQLAVGGRLVLPVGDEPRRQVLLRVVRDRAETFRTERLGQVLFVPLLGEQGWGERTQ